MPSLTFALLGAALQFAAAGASLDAPVDESRDRSRMHSAPGPCQLEALVEDIERTRIGRDIPAVSLTVTDARGTLWSGAFGSADRATGRRADDRTVFRIGSVTKMFTALALLIAQQDGSLDIGAPILQRMPDLPVQNPWEKEYPLRVSHLLEDTAGLPDLSRAEWDYNRPMPLEAALNWKRVDRITRWPPGTRHSYSNAGAGLAARVLERATGQRYEQFVEQRIFSPLGMSSAGFHPDPETLAALATGYDADGSSPIPYWHMTYRAFGAINVRPAEMAPFLRLLLNRGLHEGQPLIDEALIDRMETPAAASVGHADFGDGYGLGNYTWRSHSVRFHGHGGDADGYLSKLGYSRERGLGYFLVINVYRQRDLRALQELVEEFIGQTSKLSG